MNLNQKRFIIAGTVAAMWLGLAQAALPGCDPRLVGTWETDLSTFGPDAPRSVTITWKDIGGGKCAVDGTAARADGQLEQHLITVGPTGADGTRPVSGDPDTDSESFVSVSSRTLVETAFKNGRQVAKITYRFSLDGRHVTVDSDDGNGGERVVMRKK
jgi:hypothetical protein